MKKIMDIFFEEELVETKEVEVVKINNNIDENNTKKYEEKLNQKPKRDLNINLNVKSNENALDTHIPIQNININQKKRPIIFESKPKKTEPISPIFGPSEQKNNTITATQPSNAHAMKASKNSGVISPFHGVVKDETKQKNESSSSNNLYGVIEEIKNITVLDVDQKNVDDISDEDFLETVIDGNQEEIIVSRDISLFD